MEKIVFDISVYIVISTQVEMYCYDCVDGRFSEANEMKFRVAVVENSRIKKIKET